MDLNVNLSIYSRTYSMHISVISEPDDFGLFRDLVMPVCPNFAVKNYIKLIKKFEGSVIILFLIKTNYFHDRALQFFHIFYSRSPVFAPKQGH